MASPATGVRFTYREYLLLPDDGKRYELIGGDFFVTRTPSPWHQTVSRRLLYELMTALERTGVAQVFNAPIDVVLDDTNVVEPDLVIVGRAKWSSITHRAIEGVPDVVVEILSASSGERDRYLKFRLYEKFGVPEYWIVEPQHGFLEAYRLAQSGEGYVLRARYDRTGTLTCPDFPELSVPLLPIFADS